MSLNQRRFAGALLLVPLCVSGIVFSLFRQIPAASGLALAQAGGVTSLRVEVELVTVEVIVLDKKGTPVRSLKKEDFQLFEDGKPQEISTFDEITDDARLPSSLPDDNDPARIHGKVVLILFDDSRIASENLKLTRDSAEKYVREHMKPQDLFAIATYGTTGLKLLQNYTHDGDRVLAAIRQPAVSSARATTAGESSQEIPRTAGMRPGTGPQTTPDLSPSLGREDKYRSLAMLRGLKTLISSLEAIKGRKSILLYSEEFAITADLAIELGGTVSSARKANVAFYTIDAGGLKSGRPAGSSLKQVSPDAGTSREAAFRF